MTLHQNYIAGEWIDGGAIGRNINPSNTNDIVGEYARGDRTDVERAVAVAGQASAAWPLTTPQSRSDILDCIGTEILNRKDELGRLLSREQGKILAEGVGEAVRAGQIFKFYAGEALRLSGERLVSLRPGVEVEISREPLGVVALITPWNFPLAIPAWKIAPALAYGNCVVFKPADLVPGSAWALAEIISRSGVPDGVFNLVMGPGSSVGSALIRAADISGISFTGSVEVGRGVAAAAVEIGAKIQLEMGGKNPLIVLDDADLATAVNVAVNGAYYSTGQRCTASSRLIVQGGIHDQFVNAVADRLKQLKVDDALEPGAELGPVVSEAQLDQNLKYIDIGQREGARLVWGGERLNRKNPGYYMSPALFIDSNNAMRINREEIFGPVASVVKVRDYDEALATANDTPFGLSSGIVTASLKYASHFKRHSAAGMVMVNLPTAGVDYHAPFGGRKGSSYGPREQGSYAREFFTNVKTSYQLAPV